MLFVDEAPLTGPVKGGSGFAEAFAARGPRDGKGRSLRDFALRRRLFRYPCSYMIYTAPSTACRRRPGMRYMRGCGRCCRAARPGLATSSSRSKIAKPSSRSYERPRGTFPDTSSRCRRPSPSTNLDSLLSETYGCDLVIWYGKQPRSVRRSGVFQARAISLFSRAKDGRPGRSRSRPWLRGDVRT